MRDKGSVSDDFALVQCPSLPDAVLFQVFIARVLLFGKRLFVLIYPFRWCIARDDVEGLSRHSLSPRTSGSVPEVWAVWSVFGFDFESLSPNILRALESDLNIEKRAYQRVCVIVVFCGCRICRFLGDTDSALQHTRVLRTLFHSCDKDARYLTRVMTVPFKVHVLFKPASI